MWWVTAEDLVEAAKKQKTKNRMVPSTLSHCVLAVMKKTEPHKSKPGKKHSLRAAWNICRAHLTRYGYLKGPYKTKGKAKDIKMTQKGTRRSMKHSMEKEGPKKFKMFSREFKKIEPTV